MDKICNLIGTSLQEVFQLHHQSFHNKEIANSHQFNISKTSAIMQIWSLAENILLNANKPMLASLLLNSVVLKVFRKQDNITPEQATNAILSINNLLQMISSTMSYGIKIMMYHTTLEKDNHELTSQKNHFYAQYQDSIAKLHEQLIQQELEMLERISQLCTN